MSKVSGTNKRTRPKRKYKNQVVRGVEELKNLNSPIKPLFIYLKSQN